MKYQLEQLADCKFFSSCHFYTPFYEKEISGLSLACQTFVSRPEPDSLLLTCESLLPADSGELEALLDHWAKHRIAGFLMEPSPDEFCDSFHDSSRMNLAEACQARKLVFGTADASCYPAMIHDFYSLIAARTDGSISLYDKVLENLQHRFYTNGIDALLDALSFWTGCQTALIVGQDTFVQPPAPVLNEAIFYPAYWHKETQDSPLSHVSLYTSSYSEQQLLQAELYKNRLPFGLLCLIGEHMNFERSDYLLLNYASILCTGLDDYKRRSRQIETAIEMICDGRLPEKEVTALFPASGYALVLLEETKVKPLDGKKDYLSYLIHHHFPQCLCYSFAADGSLRLFVSAEDVEHFGQRLLAILDRAGTHYRAGVSRFYDIGQAVTAFSESDNAAHIAQLLDYPERLCYFHDLGIYRLFNYPQNSWPVNQMLGEMDELLNQMDEEKRDMLALTIRTFVKCRFSYQKTADKLFTHVNTIRYRIKLIEDLWDVDLSSDEGRLLFSVLAKLLPLWMKSGCYNGALPNEIEE